MKLSVWLAVFVVGLLMWGASVIPQKVNSEGVDNAVSGAPTLSDCSGPISWQSQWLPEIRGADYILDGSYQCAEHVVHAYVAQYLDQSRGSEATSDGQRVIPFRDREFASASVASAGPEFEVNQYQLPQGDSTIVIWSWYAIGKQHFRSRTFAKLAELFDAATFQPKSAAIIAVASNEPDARARLGTAALDVWRWYLDANRSAQTGNRE